MKHDVKIPSEAHQMLFRKPLDRWDEALPLGNGLTGCLIWGNGAPIRLSLDRADLWDTRPAPEVLDREFTYRKLVELVQSGQQEEIDKRFSNCFTLYPYPTKLPAGRIELSCGMPAEKMKCRLRLCEAVAEAEWTSNGALFRLESFLHAESGLGYIRLQGDNLEQVQLQLVPPDFAGGESIAEDSSFNQRLSSLGYPSAEFGRDEDTAWFYQRANHDLEYAVVVATKHCTEQKLEYVYKISANSDGADWLEDAQQSVHEAVETGFDEALVSHRAWWERYWLQSSLTLPDFELEKMWYWTNYLFGSCSRKGSPPMPLQGVWTADEGLLPPWKGDYHHDLNTELSYSHYLKANHLQEGESFLDFLWELRPAAQRFAQAFYEAPGINLPSVMTLHGEPLGGWPMYSLSPTNQIWLCHAFDQYWLYTGDRKFLEERAYVYFKETAECVLYLLQRGEDGKLRLPVSSSPEIHDDSLQSWLTPNSNYDLALLRYLVARLLHMSELLGLEIDQERWAEIAEALPELAVDETGFMLSRDERLLESHRHFSHAMAIYPLKTESNKKIINDTILHLERLGKGMWVGYSFAWMAAIYTRQGNGEGACFHLRQFWEQMCSPNGFHLNGDYKGTGITQFHYRPFTLEGNMAAADALQEMLLQTNNGVIRPFPAVPSDWLKKGVEFHRLRGEMGIVVSAGAAHGQLDYVRMQAERGGVFLLENRFSSDKLWIERNGSLSILECPIGSECSILLESGEKCVVRGADHHE